MKLPNNPNIEIYTKNHKDRVFNLSNIKLPEGSKKCCVWCMSELKGLQRRWCKDDECIKSALAWGRPQSAHGLYELLKRQKCSCLNCGLSWSEYMEIAVSKRSKFRDVELHSRDIELVMRRFRRLIPKNIRPEVDHILAIVLGGTALGLENHQILCAKCHKTKTKSDIKEKFARTPNPRKGVKFSEEHVRALSEARKGVDTEARRIGREKNLYPALRIPIIAINIISGEEIEFESSLECAKALNLQSSNVARVLNAKQGRKQHKGWTFKKKVDKSSTVEDTDIKRSQYDETSTDKLCDDSDHNSGD